MSLEFSIFEQFCNGERARKAALNLGCSRNTVMSHFRSLLPEMEDLVARMLLEARIATNPQTIEEVIRLEKALRAGSERKRALACRFLFLNSLSVEERLGELFTGTLAKNLEMKIVMAKRTRAFMDAQEKRKAEGKASSIRKLAVDDHRRFYDIQIPEAETQPSSPRRLIESISEELRAFIAEHYPPSLPSSACRRLGEKWVGVWRACRKLIQIHRE